MNTSYEPTEDRINRLAATAAHVALHVVGTVTPAQHMLDSGCTDAEIASALGIDLADVQRLPEMATAQLGAVHAGRVERALYSRAVGGTIKAEKLDRMGEVHELVSDLPPDPAAAKAVLAALAPERWGQAAGDRVAVVVVRFPEQLQPVAIEGEVSSVLLSPPGK